MLSTQLNLFLLRLILWCEKSCLVIDRYLLSSVGARPRIKPSLPKKNSLRKSKVSSIMKILTEMDSFPSMNLAVRNTTSCNIWRGIGLIFNFVTEFDCQSEAEKQFDSNSNYQYDIGFNFVRKKIKFQTVLYFDSSLLSFKFYKFFLFVKYAMLFWSATDIVV